MKKLLLIITILMSNYVNAQEQVSSSADLEELIFSNKELKLTSQEKIAIEIARKWKNPANAPKPHRGYDGSANFVFGAGQVSVMCAVLQLCDIQLQAGERINQNGLHLGDKSRWEIKPAVTGTGANEVIHLIVKPLDVGLDTTMIVATDRRTYNIRLRSDRNKFMPKIAFTYPEEAVAKLDAFTNKRQTVAANQVIPQTGENITELDFEYDIEGKAAWKPLRVYNNGVKTILQMPKIMLQTEAPTLLVIRENDALFSSDEEVLVNYRVVGDRFIVDNLFDKAVLIAGVGRNQQRVTIEHAPNNKSSRKNKAGKRR